MEDDEVVGVLRLAPIAEIVVAALLKGEAFPPALRRRSYCRQSDRRHSHCRTIGREINQRSGADDLLLALTGCRRDHGGTLIRLCGRAIGGKAAPDIVHQIKAGVDNDIDVIGLGQPQALRLPPAVVA